MTTAINEYVFQTPEGGWRVAGTRVSLDSVVHEYLQGRVPEAIVFVEEPAPAAPDARSPDAEDIFAEMRPFMVAVQEVDDSRKAIYTRMEGE